MRILGFTIFIILALSGCRDSSQADSPRAPATSVLSPSPTPTPDPEVENQEELYQGDIELKGDEVLEIKNRHFILQGNISLRDSARLIIENATFEHANSYAHQYKLSARDQSQVEVYNSDIKSGDWGLNWDFLHNAKFILQNVTHSRSYIWHSLHDDTEVTVRHSRLRATLNHRVKVSIEDSTDSFFEFVFPVGTSLDTALPEKMEDFTFPSRDTSAIEYQLHAVNTQVSGWGITVAPQSDVTIRDTKNLVTTFLIGSPWEKETVVLEDLRETHYDRQSWEILDTRLTLINVDSLRWSPIATGNNTLIVRNSELFDNAFNFGEAKVFFENCELSLVRAWQQVQVTLTDSIVHGDIVALEDSVITLRNTKVEGTKQSSENGRIIEE